jgi:hypothetical protein
MGCGAGCTVNQQSLTERMDTNPQCHLFGDGCYMLVLFQVEKDGLGRL